MQRKDLLKKSVIRNAEYYDMVNLLDKLYSDSSEGKVFTDLISLIRSESNIRMAYRNLKTNKGSRTPGVDGMRFEDFEKISESRLVSIVQNKIDNYQPKAVRRVYIPKPNGKKRPLGIPTVLDRIVQQSVLQIMEPICEAKFHERSYGFRPNRSTKNAVAMCYRLVQLNGFHYVVDIDIKGVFDNVDHPKLLKQLWTLGIRDKNLLSLISRMLKAPIMDGKERIYPERGTPQGGVLSPLLANVVLNELDWWIASQWEQMQVHNPLKSDYRMNPNGTRRVNYLYARLRKTRLKECQLVRYADDFKIFTKSYKDAVRIKFAVEDWLMKRLKLEASKEKSKITNLEKNYSEFLGIKFKLYRKANKWVVKSHMCDKAIDTQKKKLKEAMIQVCKAHKSVYDQHKDAIAYNQKVIGMHQYYSMATMICEDVHRLFQSIDKTMKMQAHTFNLSKDHPLILKGGMDTYFFEKYKKSKQLRYINDLVIVPVAYCRFEIPLCHSPDINKFTRAGREKIHKMLQKEDYEEALLELADRSSATESIEFCDNRISRFVASRGKCEISKVSLTADEAVCYRLIPKSKGGTDAYTNLRIIHKEMAVLINAYSEDTIIRQMKKFDRKVFNADAMKKINKWRNKIDREPVILKELNILWD